MGGEFAALIELPIGVSILPVLEPNGRQNFFKSSLQVTYTE